MSVYKTLKSKFYFLKLWYRQLFLYPELKGRDATYGEYWKDREYSAGLNDWQRERADFVVSVLKKGTVVETLVDIGCGNGSILNYLGNVLSIKNRVGIDLSPHVLKEAGAQGIQTIQADVATDPESIPKNDYTLLFEVLEHTSDSETLLKEALKKTSGGVFFSFPNTGYFTYRLRLLFGKTPMQWRVHPGEHVRFWTKRDLLWWLDALGIKEYTIHFYKGVPLLNKFWPALFAAGFVVYLPKKVT